MANISYTPTFHHRPWRDRVDRVEAGGPNGFNGRFTAIESDLHQVSTVVTQIGAELDQIDAERQHRLALTPPTLQAVDGWQVDSDGAPTTTLFGIIGGGGPTAIVANGVVNLDLPHGARLTGMRIRGQYTGRAAGVPLIFSAGVNRIPRLTSTPGAFDAVVSAGETSPQHVAPFDFTGSIPDESTVVVDLDTFRYFLAITIETGNSVGLIVTLETVDITYVA